MQLPSEPGAALAGITLASRREFAVEAREQPGVRVDGELAAGLDARGIACRARAVDRERGVGQRDERGVDRAIRVEFVHPREPCVGRQGHAVAEDEAGIELRTQEGRQRGDAARAEAQAERVDGAGRQRARLGEAVLPELRRLHRRKRRDREPTPGLLPAHLYAAAQKIAAEAAACGLRRTDADDAARLAVAERREAQCGSRIELLPSLDRVAAEMRALEMAAGDAVADGEVRAA